MSGPEINIVILAGIGTVINKWIQWNGKWTGTLKKKTKCIGKKTMAPRVASHVGYIYCGFQISGENQERSWSVGWNGIEGIFC